LKQIIVKAPSSETEGGAFCFLCKTISWPEVAFGDVLLNGTRNRIYKRKEFHGSGVKIVNMGELFANPRLFSIPMKRVELKPKEKEKICL
jgi:type I restriction enzyme S subunit